MKSNDSHDVIVLAWQVTFNLDRELVSQVDRKGVELALLAQFCVALLLVLPRSKTYALYSKPSV